MAEPWTNYVRPLLIPIADYAGWCQEWGVVTLVTTCEKGDVMRTYKGTDINLKKWHSLSEGLMWISFRAVRVTQLDGFILLSEMEHDCINFSALGRAECVAAKETLFSYVADGDVAIRGKRALGEFYVHRENSPWSNRSRFYDASVSCDNLADYEIIPTHDVLNAGVNGLTRDNILYAETRRNKFAFKDVQIDFSQLLEKQRPPNNIAFQIDGARAPVTPDNNPAVQLGRISAGTNNIIKMTDAILEKIVVDPNLSRWTRDAIEAEVRGMFPDTSKRKAEVVAYILLDDADLWAVPKKRVSPK